MVGLYGAISHDASSSAVSSHLGNVPVAGSFEITMVLGRWLKSEGVYPLPHSTRCGGYKHALGLNVETMT
jgi:hypothetical protein